MGALHWFDASTASIFRRSVMRMRRKRTSACFYPCCAVCVRILLSFDSYMQEEEEDEHSDEEEDEEEDHEIEALLQHASVVSGLWL